MSIRNKTDKYIVVQKYDRAQYNGFVKINEL